MLKDNTFVLYFDSFNVGLAPLSHLDPLTFLGKAGHASVMSNVDIISKPGLLTQGPGLANLTNGNEAGVVSELINFIIDKAVASDATYAIGNTKLFKLSSTTVASGGTPSWPRTITGATAGNSCIEFQGALYYFYNKASGGDCGKYDLDATFDDDWGCYSDDTEVFTVNGWKKIKDVKVGDKIYSLNPQTKEVEITVNNQIINKPFNGEMISFKNEGVDLLTTPDHKMFAGFRKMKNGQIHTDWRIVRADSLLNKAEIKLKKNAIWNGKIVDNWTIPEYDNGSLNVIQRDNLGRIKSCSGKRYYRSARKFLIKPFLRLLGFYISEGSSNEKAIIISQKTYSKGWQPIKDTLDELGVSYGYYGNDFAIHDKQLTQYIRSIIPNGFYNKRIPREIMELHPSLLIELFDALMLGDGSGEWQYTTSSPFLRDDFIELVNRLGQSAHYIKTHQKGDKCFHGIATADGFQITINKLKNETTLNHHKSFGGKILKENYIGNIVCLVLEKNHIMLVRRNGKSVWCGNSTIPTGAAALQNAPHPVAKKEDIMLFGNGRYVGTFISSTNTLAATKLDFGANTEVADVCFHANQWWLAVNSGITTGTNRASGQVYLYAGAATTAVLDDEVAVGVQKIGWIYPVNGIVYICYQDISGVNAIGYIMGRQIKPLRYFTGTLPTFAQKSLYKNTIIFLSSGLVYSVGAVIEQLPVQLSQYMDAGFSTVGALACPFGTPLVASTESTSFKLAKASGLDVSCSWKSIIIPVASGRMKGMIDTVVVFTKTLEAGASCSLTIEADQASSTSSAKTITTTGKRRHVFTNFSLTDIEDFRIAISWSGGDTVNDCPIRFIHILGHWVES